MDSRRGDAGVICDVRTSNDVDWVVARVLLGDRVVFRAGGMRRPRRHGVGAAKALRAIGFRLSAIGGDLSISCAGSRVGRLLRGRTALARSLPDDDGDPAGVREPRRPSPTRPSVARARRA